MSVDRVKKAVKDALWLIRANDAFLFEADAHERTIAARFALYLLPYFPEHQIDPEYNRHGLNPKVVDLPANCGGRRRVIPDIVVHQRGRDDENLLIIQIKKETNPEPRECDRAVIAAMKDQLGYSYGVLIDFPAGNGAKNRRPHVEWF